MNKKICIFFIIIHSLLLVVNVFCETFDDYLNKAEISFNEQKYEEALLYIENAIRLNPDNAQAYVYLGSVQYQLNNINEVINALYLAIEKDNTYADAYNNLGFIYFVVLKDYEKAFENFNKAVNYDNNNDKNYRHRAMSFAHAGNYLEAFMDYSKAIKINPLNPENYRSRAAFLYELHKYQEALDDYNEAIKINGGNVNVFNGRGVVYYDLQRYEEAIEDFTKAIQFGANNYDAYINRGTAYHAVRNYITALEDYNNAIRIKQNDKMAFRNRAIIYQELARTTDDSRLRSEYLQKAREDMEREKAIVQ